MTEISNTYYETKMEDLNETMREIGFDVKFNDETKKEIIENTERMEIFSKFCGIETIEQLMELGIDGMRYGNCDNGYENLYRLSRKCFKGQSFRESFSSSTLYFFWQQFAFSKGLMCVRTYSNNGNIITERLIG